MLSTSVFQLSASERERLQAHGHTVRHRLFGLNISRMLGDRFLKDENLGFIAEPHVGEMQVGRAGREWASDLICFFCFEAVPPEDKGLGFIAEPHMREMQVGWEWVFDIYNLQVALPVWRGSGLHCAAKRGGGAGRLGVGF